MINRDLTPLFVNFYQEYYNTDEELISDYYQGNNSWLIFSADDEFMVLATLKFEMYVMTPWGTSVQITD